MERSKTILEGRRTIWRTREPTFRGERRERRERRSEVIAGGGARYNGTHQTSRFILLLKILLETVVFPVGPTKSIELSLNVNDERYLIGFEESEMDSFVRANDDSARSAFAYGVRKAMLLRYGIFFFGRTTLGPAQPQPPPPIVSVTLRFEKM